MFGSTPFLDKTKFSIRTYGLGSQNIMEWISLQNQKYGKYNMFLSGSCFFLAYGVDKLLPGVSLKHRVEGAAMAA